MRRLLASFSTLPAQSAGRRRRRLQFEALESRRLLAVTINEFPVTPPGAYPSFAGGLEAGPDGNMWFTGRNTTVRGKKLRP